MILTLLQRMKGGESRPSKKPLSKIAWSWLGAFVGIYLVSILNQLLFTDMSNHLFLVGSFGASAVLIYAVPQSDLSQPRNLIGGHIISALIGISLFKFLQVDITILAALAVSISIVVMHYTLTLHPPGGATALIAVIGSQEIHELGYMFVIYPIASGALILLFVALVVNNLSGNSKRHYPRYW